MLQTQARSLIKLTCYCLLSIQAIQQRAYGGDANLELTVHVFDYAGVQAAVMAKAQSAAYAILREAGIHVRWSVCPVGGSPAISTPACEARTDATHLALVMLPDHMARKVVSHPRQFGLAVLTDKGFAIQAYIFAHHIVNFAKEEMVQFSQALGPVMAHEIGHLLLGTNSHFPVGIMRGDWRSGEVKQALMGTLGFTPDQVKLVRGNVCRRMETR